MSNTDSLAEQIQAALPDAHVAKSLNTMSAAVMVEPCRLPGPHVVFVAGNDEGAKASVTGLLGELGWSADQVLDLGALRSARGSEMFLPLWLSMMGTLGTGDFNTAVARSQRRVGPGSHRVGRQVVHRLPLRAPYGPAGLMHRVEGPPSPRTFAAVGAPARTSVSSRSPQPGCPAADGRQQRERSP